METASEPSIFFPYWYVLRINFTRCLEGLRGGLKRSLPLPRKKKKQKILALLFNVGYFLFVGFTIHTNFELKPHKKKKDYLESIRIDGKCKMKSLSTSQSIQRSRCTYALFRNRGSIYMRVTEFVSRLLYRRGTPWYSLNRRLGGTQNRSGHFENRTISFPKREIIFKCILSQQSGRV